MGYYDGINRRRVISSREHELWLEVIWLRTMNKRLKKMLEVAEELLKEHQK